MKNYLLLLITVLSTSFSNAQVKVDSTGVLGDNYNRWTIDVYFGQAKGIKPYADGYYSSNPERFFGGFQANSFGVAGRYMLSPKFGFKLDLNYDKFTNIKGNGSLDFETSQYRLGLQGVVNAVRLFDLQESFGRFGLLIHGGFQVARMHSNLLDKDEFNGGLVFGFSPQFRISNSFSIISDFSLLSNYRQHLNWDGSYAEPSNNLSGQMFVSTIGLSYSFGNQKIHGDWAIIQDKKDKEINDLNSRIGEIETLMNDTDKDGVPDYLDVENNSLTGVAVDTKGRMIDKNANGVPDELEKYIENSITNNNSTNSSTLSKGMVEQLINEGYIAAYFDMNSSQPSPSSAENIGFILNYLRNNPSASVEISGYADEVGNSSKNEKLAANRAANVKAILVKAGINPSRLNAKGAGIDKSVDKDSEYARRLVRKTVFKITN